METWKEHEVHFHLHEVFYFYRTKSHRNLLNNSRFEPAVLPIEFMYLVNTTSKPWSQFSCYRWSQFTWKHKVRHDIRSGVCVDSRCSVKGSDHVYSRYMSWQWICYEVPSFWLFTESAINDHLEDLTNIEALPTAENKGFKHVSYTSVPLR